MFRGLRDYVCALQQYNEFTKSTTDAGACASCKKINAQPSGMPWQDARFMARHACIREHRELLSKIHKPGTLWGYLYETNAQTYQNVIDVRG